MPALDYRPNTREFIEGPPKLPPKPPAPPPPTDPRVLPCVIGDEVSWEGKRYECQGVRLRDGRYRTAWNLAKEDIQGYNPETGRVEIDEGRIERIVHGVIKATLHAAAAVAVGTVVAPLLLPITTKIGELTKGLGELTRLTPALKRVQEEHKRVSGILDATGIATSVRTLRTIHQIARTTSAAYRAQIDKWTREVGLLSRRVFGRADTLASALALTQMAIYDSYALQGRSIDEADAAYLDLGVRLTERVRDQSRRYAQTPSLFWADWQQGYLQPYLDRTARLGEQATRRVGVIERGLETVTRASERLSARALEYQRELDPFIGEGQMRQLDAIRRRFNSDILEPLTEINAWWREVWPEQAEVLAGTVEIVGQHTEEIDDLQSLLPHSLDQAAAAAVRRRRVWTDILDDTLTPTGDAPSAVRPVSARVEAAYRAILGEE